MKFNAFISFTLNILFFSNYCAEVKKVKIETISLHAEIKIQNTYTKINDKNFLDTQLLSKACDLFSSDKFVLFGYDSIEITGTNFFDKSILEFLSENFHYLPVRLLFENYKLRKSLFLEFQNIEFKDKKYNLLLALKLSYKDEISLKLDYENDSSCIIL
jgi:hypothetical protein